MHRFLPPFPLANSSCPGRIRSAALALVAALGLPSSFFGSPASGSVSMTNGSSGDNAPTPPPCPGPSGPFRTMAEPASVASPGEAASSLRFRAGRTPREVTGSDLSRSATLLIGTGSASWPQTETEHALCPSPAPSGGLERRGTAPDAAWIFSVPSE